MVVSLSFIRPSRAGMASLRARFASKQLLIVGLYVVPLLILNVNWVKTKDPLWNRLLTWMHYPAGIVVSCTRHGARDYRLVNNCCTVTLRFCLLQSDAWTACAHAQFARMRVR